MKKNGILFIILILTILNSACFIHLNEYSITTFASNTTNSKNNEMLEFSAYGINPYGDSINVSDQGGYVIIDGTKLEVMPWSYVNFTEENMFVFYLANVTTNSFDIMFLYLDYSFRIISLRHFDYRSASDEWILGFSGEASVSNKKIYTPSIEMPPITIEPKAKISNSIYIQGKDLYFVDRIGYMLNGSNRLEAYPLLNILDSNHGWNQLWTLLLDEEGLYYFSIFNIVSNYNSSVTRGQTLRLNDYNSLEHIQYNASWKISDKSYNMTVVVPFEGFSIAVDGFNFNMNEKKMIIPISAGNHEIYVPNDFKIEENQRYIFDSWGDGTSKNPRSIKISQNIDVSVNYLKQNKLVVESQYLNYSSLYWADYGSLLNIEIPEEIYPDNGTRHVFIGWSGDLGSNQSKIDVNMTSPKTLIANWKTQFLVSFIVLGVPENSLMELKMNDEYVDILVPDVYEMWVDSDNKINLNIKTKVIKDGALRYDIIEWREEKLGKITSPIIIDRPMKISVFLEGIRGMSSIECHVDQTNFFQNEQVDIFGSVDPPREDVPVNLYYSSQNGSWNNIAEVSTNENGMFLYSWKPNETGSINIRSGWLGNNKYEGSVSNATMIYVSQNSQNFVKNLKKFNSKASDMIGNKLPEAIPNGLNSSINLVVNTMDEVHSIIDEFPLISSLLAISIASMLVGIIFLIPILFIILTIFAYFKGTKRWDRGLKYLLVFWLLSIALLTFIEVVFIRSLALAIVIFFISVFSILFASVLALTVERFAFRRIRPIK